jgi:hypothetical protein
VQQQPQPLVAEVPKAVPEPLGILVSRLIASVHPLEQPWAEWKARISPSQAPTVRPAGTAQPLTDGKPGPRPRPCPAGELLLRGHQQQLTDAVQRVVLAARWLAADAGLRCINGCCGNTPTRVQLCVLYPSCTLGAMAEETAERAKLLLRGLSPHRQAWTLTAHPNAYGVGPTILKQPLTSVCAGRRLCGAPRRNRTGDPILTIDARGVHAAMQHLTSPHTHAGGRRFLGLGCEAARGCV